MYLFIDDSEKDEFEDTTQRKNNKIPLQKGDIILNNSDDDEDLDVNRGKDKSVPTFLEMGCNMLMCTEQTK